jgi:very-short-patch-repair endonuclease
VGVKTCRKRVTEISRKLRKTPTETEKFLWKYLRNKQLRGFKFRRQQPIGSFINFEGKLIIEADGG